MSQYAGTSAENKFGYYGLWVATFSDSIGDTSGGYWQGVEGIFSKKRSPEPQFLIYDITMDSDGNLYASTGGGLYYIPEYGKGGKGDNRGRDGWMASLTRWT